MDTSSSFYWLGPDKSRDLIRRWGVHRVLFGTDYPMWFPAPEIRHLLDLNLSDEEYRLIFWSNAKNVFGLGDPDAQP